MRTIVVVSTFGTEQFCAFSVARSRPEFEFDADPIPKSVLDYERIQHRESEDSRSNDRERTNPSPRCVSIYVLIDPSAGSPTNTLLRLLHPPRTDAQ